MRGVPTTSVVLDYIDRFPDSPTRTLARLAYRENPELWNTPESCRTAFRLQRGSKGNAKRHLAQRAESRKTAKRRQQNPFGQIPEGLREIDDWAPYVINGPCRVLIIGDLHVPYHERDALLVALESDADAILINGDFLDCFSLSRWLKDPRKRDFAGELATGRMILETIRKARPKSRIVLKLGNHEERLESYLFTKAPELLGVADFEIDRLLRCADYRIEIVRDKRPIMLGKVYVLHGHEYLFSIQNPVNPARGLYLRSNVSALCGHFHQSSHHSQKSLAEKITSCWSTGCLCDMHPRWQPLNKWNLGFAIATIDRDGGFSVQNVRIIDGKVWS